MPGYLFILLAVCLISSSCEHHQAHDKIEGTLLIRDVTVINGHGGEPLFGVDVLVNQDTIAAIKPTGEWQDKGEYEIIEATGMYLVPGFIDMHAHALIPTCEKTPNGVQFAGFNWSLSVESAQALLQFGITTARSPSTPTELGIAFRDSLAAGSITGPQFVVSGEFINGWRVTPEEVRIEIQKQAAAGVDYIKLYSQLEPEVVQAGIDEAHRHGLQAIGHLGRTTWTQAARDGIDFLTHAVPWTEEMLNPEYHEPYRHARSNRGGIRARIDWLEWVDPESNQVGAVIDTLVKYKISLDPTLVAYNSKFSFDWENERPVSAKYRENPNLMAAPGLLSVWTTCRLLTEDWAEEDFSRMEAAWPSVLAIVHRYHKEGLMLTAGSDTPNHWVIPGESLHQEMEFLVEAGISPLEVLTIATKNGASALGMLDQRGTIEIGKQADLVALSANPLDNISNTRRIAWVVQRGSLIFTNSL